MPSARRARYPPPRPAHPDSRAVAEFAARRPTRARTVFCCALLIAVAAAAAGCSGKAEAEPALGFTERDSAFVDEHGQRAVVNIVASAEPAWDAAGGWRVSDSPRLVLDGRVLASAPFGRITAATRAADGRVIVADAASRALRVFDPAGRPLHALGDTVPCDDCAGFPGIGGVALRGDTVLALDAPATVVRFGPEGERLRADDAPLLDRFAGFDAEYVRLLTDGTLLAWLYEREPDLPAAGGFRPLQGFLRLHPGTAREDTIGWYPGLEHVRTAGAVRWVAFGAGSDAAADDDFIYVGDARAGAIDVRDHDGRLHRRIDLPQPAPVTAADLDRFRAAFRARVLASAGPDAVTGYEAMLAELSAAEALPAFRSLRTDGAGNLWVEAYPWPADRDPRWSVFDRDGRWLGDVATPPGLSILEIGADHLLGVRAEPGQADRLELYELRKPPGSRSPLRSRGVAGG